MRLLVTHSWLRGNLGDVLQASVLLRTLRALRPSALHLAGYPARPGKGARELLDLADRHLPEPFGWHLHYAPRILERSVMGPSWRKRRRELFSRYDAIVSAPGPFLAHYDARSSSALEDIAVASELGLPFILASHSIGPLRQEGLARLRRVSLCVARESTSFDYLKAHGIPAVSSADLAFLYPFEDAAAKSSDKATSIPYRVLILRSNNIRLHDVYRAGTRLRVGAWEISLTATERLVVATSDEHRDASFVGKLSKHLKATPVACTTVPELVALIRSSTGVISDRYHPAICAAALGKPVMVLPNREPHKMAGLEALLGRNDLHELKRLATVGLDAVRDELSRVRGERTP